MSIIIDRSADRSFLSIVATRRPVCRPVIVALLIAIADGAAAQAPPASSVCWRARPLETCRSWIVTEVAVEMPAYSTAAAHRFGDGASSYVSNDFDGRLAFTIGAMLNRGPGHALGATASVTGTDADEIPRRAEIRYRRWLGPRHGFDASAGVARQTIRGDHELESIRAVGLTLSAGVASTYIGSDGRIDILHGNGRPVVGGFLGVRVGSRAAPVAAAVGFVLAIAAFRAITGPNY